MTDTELSKNENADIESRSKSKILRLFTYIEKVLSINETIERDFRKTLLEGSNCIWLSSLPKNIENLSVRTFNCEHSPDVDKNDEPWLRVKKITTDPAPLLPGELNEWIINISPLEIPTPKEAIKREILFKDDKHRKIAFEELKKQQREGNKEVNIPDILDGWVIFDQEKLAHLEKTYYDDYWVNHPELHNLLEGYIKTKWEQWASKMRDIYIANCVYDQLYALRQILKTEGDNCELLLGHGLLTWHKKDNIYSPIFNIPLNLEFTPATKTIELGPDPLFRSFVEITPLYEIDEICEEDIDRWSTKINENPFDFWHLESLKLQSKTLVSYLSTDGNDEFDQGETIEPVPTIVPTIWNAPVIYCRKRSNSMWSKYAKSIKSNIEKNDEISTDFIKDLVGEYTPDESNSGLNPKNELNTSSIETINAHEQLTDGELYFPLLWNEEQKRIAEEIEKKYGVVTKGPPGTGKTHTIANLISRFLSQGKSVLVVAQKGEPLKVLRDKLPQNIRSLAISQLGNSLDKNSVLQQSIGEISSNLSEKSHKFTDKQAKQLRDEIKSVREQKALLANRLRSVILTDSAQSIEIDGHVYNPISAAKLIAKYRNDSSLNWEIDKVPYDCEINFSVTDLQHIAKILNQLDDLEADLYKYNLPNIEDLPEQSEIKKIFESFRTLKKESILWPYENTDLTSTDQKTIENLINSISNAQSVLNSITNGYLKEIYDAATSSKYEERRWRTILEKISTNINLIGECNNCLIGHTIEGKSELTTHDLLDALNTLQSKSKKKGYIPKLLKIALPSNAKKLLDSFRVDSRPINTLSQINLLKAKISINKAYSDVTHILTQAFSTLYTKPDIDEICRDILSLEKFTSDINNVLCYESSFLHLKDFFEQSERFKNLSYFSFSDLKKSKDLLKSLLANIKLSLLNDTINQWKFIIKNDSVNLHPTLTQLLEAIDQKNEDAWKYAFESLKNLANKQPLSNELHILTEKINQVAPLFLSSFIRTIRSGDIHPALTNLSLRWKLARLTSWIEMLHKGVDISKTQIEIERLAQQELALNSELVTTLSWQRQIQKVTKRQRDALMAWSTSMKKYGKGTGKYAKRWLREAQDALQTAMHAVPVWIMPINRAAQMFSNPKAGMFDVVIFDEASQCDIKGLNICYLGKKILIVGDPNQISPAGIFLDQNKAFDLTSRYLYDVPHKNSFSITSSLFDIAKIRIPTMIQLNEHFRCVPQIIDFSNHHVYESKLKPLRYPQPKGLLTPPLVPIYVESGYQNQNNKVNEPEAKAIVDQLIKCLSDPEYKTRPDGSPCTFGIISLLATDQAKYIKELLNNHPDITEEIIERHSIVVGDSYTFQGDERNVILLSMVKALDPNKQNDTIKAMTDESAKQRFNVAMTRAKDQVFLFHSFPETILHNEMDWRYKLLKWFYNPRDEELNSGRSTLEKAYKCGLASAFSYEVGNLIIDKGYKVIPEYETLGRRIDLVVQGENARLAVECDGDQYHTLEKFDEDYAREQQLRRAGWVFWRITGSSFYLNKEHALDGLWVKLEELGIMPII